MGLKSITVGLQTGGPSALNSDLWFGYKYALTMNIFQQGHLWCEGFMVPTK